MSRPGQDDEPPEPRGSLRPLSAGALTGSAVGGLVLGWGIHRVMSTVTGDPPVVTWAQPLALVLVAAIMAVLAWHTWQTVQVRHQRLEVHQAVNRLVLARACALGGTVVGAGYLGYAISWIGDESQYSERWVTRALVAALAAAAVTGASLVLERACRADGGERRP